MASGSRFHARFTPGPRALRLFGVAGLAVVAAAAGCGKVSSTDITGASRADSVSYTISIELAATSTPPSSELGFTVSAKDKDGNLAKDGTTLSLSGDSLGTVTPTTVTLSSGKATAKFIAGTSEGTSTIKAKYDSRTSQTVTVKIDKAAGTTSGSGGTAETGDEFPYGIENITWDNGQAGDVGAWEVTAKITDASHTSSRLTMVNNCSDVWPHVQKAGWDKPSVGNYWVIGQVGGNWYAATVDWVGVNRHGMHSPHFNGDDDMYGRLGSWRPQKGEEAFVMISTHARSGVINNNKQRTQIVRITMYQ